MTGYQDGIFHNSKHMLFAADIPTEKKISLPEHLYMTFGM